MSRIYTSVVNDLQAGRQSWRVMLLLIVPALAAGLAMGVMQ